ncbi:autotransporter outer membrane beta-barrel domain-containing protein [Rhizobium binxianense]|uniref:autotransporter outer membrane beta-barrel domain-containing protein n=1 Tax=Rhizobium binxianense TaxID=3024242 RepID=UPI0023612869|nr:autotransporter outer membrane beta-barrel domain-containing protein [Rhizobium sp. MJ37]MDC9837861.1 autotransporter outer membrane beta-barrel domain-containing protein [Rhizobium sp. MJ37]
MLRLYSALASSAARSPILAALVTGGSLMTPSAAFADCVTLGGVITCDTAAPNPYTTTVGAGNSAAADNITVNVGTGAQVAVGDLNAISLRNNAVITIAGGGLVSATAVSTTGNFNTGGNAIEVNNNGTVTIEQGGQLLALGSQGSAEAVNFQGTGNVLTNSGLIDASNAVAIWSQNTSGLNTVINNETGIIEARNGTTSTVIGGSGAGALDFTNKGIIRGSINLANGNDILRLYTGSTVTGNFTGGGGTDAIFLSGDGQSSMAGNFNGFESLVKNDLGTWTLTGTITGVTVATVQNGTLVLTGTNTAYTGQVIVDPAGTLEARAQALPTQLLPANNVANITNNGLVRFAQPDDGTYVGQIVGTGAVEKTGAGVLTLEPSVAAGNTYSGGTFINGGVVAVGADNALGASTGGVSFNGGTLQLNSSFDLSPSRAVTLNVGGGTIDTQAFDSTLAQGVTGPGGLTKTGTGSLVLTGNSDYSGGTVISAGTLQLGNGGTSGSISGDVLNNSLLAFNRSDAFLVPGIISGSGAVEQNGSGTTVLAGNNTYTGGTTINAGTLQLGNGGTSGSIVGDVANDGSLAFNRSDRMNFDGVISGSGDVRQIGAGTTILTAQNTYLGATTVEAGTLAAGTTNAFSPTSPTSVLASGTLDAAGFDQTVSVLTNAGLVNVGGAPGTTLTVSGNYAGADGTLRLNTALGGDASTTDRLVVLGDTSGATTLVVANVGGTGALTVEGIRVIDVAGSSAGSFALDGDYVFDGDEAVIGGAYAYRLYKNGIATPTDGDWYLRSALGDPADSTSPLYHPGVPVYEAYAQTLLGLNGLPTLQQRVGNRYWSGAGNGMLSQADGPGTIEPAPQPSEGGPAFVEESGVWARIEGAHGSFDPRTSTSSTDYDLDTWKIQSGLDGQLYESDSGKLVGGFTAHYGKASADVSSIFGDGEVDTDGYGVGGTLTWYGQNGFYLDGQAQATWYESDLSSGVLGSLSNGNDGFGYAFSLETGKRIDLNQSWTLTPQAQLAYSNVDFDDFTDPFGANVSLGTGESLKGRLGISADYENAWEGASRTTTRTVLYGIANLYYELLDGTEVGVSGVSFASESDRTWGGIGAGGSYNWNDDKYSLYGEVSINTSLSNFADSYSLTGTAGFRVRF